jgi:hypothetical protein
MNVRTENTIELYANCMQIKKGYKLILSVTLIPFAPSAGLEPATL